jgi:hypothetical protein
MPTMSWSLGSTARPILRACRGMLIYLEGYSSRRLRGEEGGLYRGRPNPMVSVPLDYVVDDEETLLRLLAEQGASIEPNDPGSSVRSPVPAQKGMV